MQAGKDLVRLEFKIHHSGGREMGEFDRIKVEARRPVRDDKGLVRVPCRSAMGRAGCI